LCLLGSELATLETPGREVKKVYRFEPLLDPRWERFLQRHSRASIFHSSGWLGALARTYNYQPIVYTTTPPGRELENGMVFCRIATWLTGRRLVSLPFSDHCDPLVDAKEDLRTLVGGLEQECRERQYRYLEFRPLSSCEIPMTLSRTDVPYSFHALDLERDLDTIFRGFHTNSIQRKIRRAEREGVTCQEGSSEELFEHFYEIFKLTRKRHRLPTQPREWFVNLMHGLGGALKIRVAFHDGRATAAMMTVRFKDTLVYKYGCSDAQRNYLGSMPLLYWKAIQEAKSRGMKVFDLGRTDALQHGLITFKNRWGAEHSLLMYSRYSTAKRATHLFDLPAAEWKAKLAKSAMSCLPSSALSFAGRFLYRHTG
jgi:hypothetical protein